MADNKQEVDPNVVRNEGDTVVGSVKAYYLEKGYGFAQCDDNGPDVFIHQSEVKTDGFRCLQKGQRIQFIYTTRNGKATATNVTAEGGSDLPVFASRLEATQMQGADPNALRGTVKVFFTNKGYGFITPDNGGEEIFVHIGETNQVYLQKGEKVTYKVKGGEGREKTTAVDVRAMRDPNAPAGFPAQPYMPYGPMGAQRMPMMAPPPVYGAAPSPFGAAPAAAGLGQGGILKTGTVKWFDAAKGFGFITPSAGGPEVYVNRSNVKTDNGCLDKDEPVEYMEEVSQGNDKIWAVNVTATLRGRGGAQYGNSLKRKALPASPSAYKVPRGDYAQQARQPVYDNGAGSNYYLPPGTLGSDPSMGGGMQQQMAQAPPARQMNDYSDPQAWGAPQQQPRAQQDYYGAAPAAQYAQPSYGQAPPPRQNGW